MPLSREEGVARMRAWLLENRPGLAPERLDERTDIIETRILESLQLVEFLLFIERLSGREVLSESLDPKQLRTLGDIYKRFWEAPDGKAERD